MTILKKNLRALFLLILLGGTLILALMLYQRWQTIYSSAETYQANRAELVAQSVDSVLRNKELVLDVLGRELLRIDDMSEASRQLPLLDTVLDEDSDMVGFGFARPDGQLVMVSSNLDLTQLSNLRENPDTGDTFVDALASQVMVLGRTYYMEALGDWLIPIRKALRSNNGDVVGVMTGGLRLNSADSIFGKNLHDGPNDAVILFRDKDAYVQAISREGVTTDVYDEPFAPLQGRESRRAGYLAQMGMSEKEAKEADRVFVIELERDGTEYLSAVSFNQRYKFWVVSETEVTSLWRQFVGDSMLYGLSYVLIFGALFSLFFVISRAEIKRSNELLHFSQHDDLTQLLNRNGLLDRLNRLIVDARPFSLVIINIDNFKAVNDRFGQETGDKTLVEFGRRLNEHSGVSDSAARLGSDKFVILTPATDLDRRTEALTRLVDAMGQPISVGPLKVQVSASVGVARFPENGESLSKLLRSGHLALYEAKQNRNSICLYRPEMEELYLRRIEVEQRLRSALADHALTIAFQPQVDTEARIVGLEALVRWNDDKLGPVSPAEFVEVAERTGLMKTLGDFVLDTSLREFSELLAEISRPIDLAINISVIQFTHPDFYTDVLDALARHKVSPKDVVLEITETLFIEQFEAVLDTMTQLRKVGIRISMDDFGTGYSSLSLLRELPLDELKIDKSFVDSILEDSRAAHMIESIVLMARSYGMELVAEGVEEEEQAQMLIGYGCPRFQGFYFYRPEPMTRIREILLF